MSSFNGHKPIPAKQGFKKGPHASFAKPPPVPRPVEVSDDEDDDSDDEPVVTEKKKVQPAAMEDEDESDMFPSIKVSGPKKDSKPVVDRVPIIFNRIKTDAPFQVNGLLFFKNYGTLTFAVSPEDAKYINNDLVENFGADPDKPLVKLDEGWKQFMLRGKPQGALAMCMDDIATKRSYTIHYYVGEWANSQTLESGVTAQIVDLRDKKGNSVIKVDITFPEGSTYSAGRLITAEEAEELKRSAGK